MSGSRNEMCRRDSWVHARLPQHDFSSGDSWLGGIHPTPFSVVPLPSTGNNDMYF